MPTTSFAKRVRRLERLLPTEDRVDVKVALPDGQQVSLVAARELLLDRNAWLGISPRRMRQLLKRQQKKFDLLKQAVVLRRGGKTLRQISLATGVSQAQLSQWLRGNALPELLSLKVFESQARKRKKIEIDKNRHKEFAYVLGAFFGNAFKQKLAAQPYGERMIQLTTIDKEFADVFKDNIEKSTGLSAKQFSRPDKRGGRQGTFSAYFISTTLIQLLNKETNYGSTIPSKFLRNRDAKINFIKALFDSGGVVKFLSTRRPYLVLRTRNKHLQGFVSETLTELGISNTAQGKTDFSGMNVVWIGSDAAQKFKKVVGFSARRRQAML